RDCIAVVIATRGDVVRRPGGKRCEYPKAKRFWQIRGAREIEPMALVEIGAAPLRAKIEVVRRKEERPIGIVLGFGKYVLGHARKPLSNGTAPGHSKRVALQGPGRFNF